MLTFYFSGTEGRMTQGELLTSGLVGRQLRLEFSPDWAGLAKTLVFSNGQVTVSVPFSGNPTVIPAKILEKPLKKLTLGVYGVGDGGNLVIPTIRAEGPRILPGVKPSDDPATDPTLPIWAQLLALIGDLSDLNTQEKGTLVDALNEVLESGIDGEDGATFLPSVSQEGIISWTNDAGLPNPDPVSIRGPRGLPGDAPSVKVTAITGGHQIRVIANGLITDFNVMDGTDGYSPVRGVDYWTETDRAAIQRYVEQAILGGEW